MYQFPRLTGGHMRSSQDVKKCIEPGLTGMDPMAKEAVGLNRSVLILITASLTHQCTMKVVSACACMIGEIECQCIGQLEPLKRLLAVNATVT